MAKRSPRRKLILRTFILAAVVVLLVVGLVSGLLQRVGTQGLYATGLLTRNGPSTIDPSIFDRRETPLASTLPAKPEHPVLGESTPASGALADKVRAKIAEAGPVTGVLVGQVVDDGDGATLYDQDGTRSGVPASTQKILTSLVALDLMGPGKRFSTKVVRLPAEPSASSSPSATASPAAPGPNRIWLVGGGDPYLSRGQLADLAQRTAGQLKTDPRGPVEVVVDASLFPGPAWHPDWLPYYRDSVSPTSALWVDQGRTSPAVIGPRSPNPPRVAADYFVGELRRLGVAVSGVSDGTAPAQASEIADVVSLPLENIVESVLVHSDNDAAEVLFRHIGVASGKTGSITDAQAATQQGLQRLGVWTEGMRTVDGSGMARTNMSSPAAMVRALKLGVADDKPNLRALATGMSVAAAEGTLVTRYIEPGTGPGRGLVRGKTGTLTEVHTLAGFVRDDDGSLLLFSFIVNGPQDEWGTRVWLDKVTSSLSTCGCKA